MSIASPTLRSSSSTVPGPSLSKAPISIRARPSTAETCTGTSNTASRSEAMRVVGPSGSGASGVSICDSPPSRLGSGILLSSLILCPPQFFMRRREGARGPDITRYRLADRSVSRGAVAIDAAVRPLDAAIARRETRLGEHHQPALETLGPHDVVELFLRRGIERIVDAYGDMRRCDQLLEAIAGQCRDFGERLARDQRRREVSAHRHH